MRVEGSRAPVPGRVGGADDRRIDEGLVLDDQRDLFVPLGMMLRAIRSFSTSSRIR